MNGIQMPVLAALHTRLACIDGQRVERQTLAARQTSKKPFLIYVTNEVDRFQLSCADEKRLLIRRPASPMYVCCLWSA